MLFQNNQSSNGFNDPFMAMLSALSQYFEFLLLLVPEQDRTLYSQPLLSYMSGLIETFSQTSFQVASAVVIEYHLEFHRLRLQDMKRGASLACWNGFDMDIYKKCLRQ